MRLYGKMLISSITIVVLISGVIELVTTSILRAILRDVLKEETLIIISVPAIIEV